MAQFLSYIRNKLYQQHNPGSIFNKGPYYIAQIEYGPLVGFKYVFVFEYRNFVYLNSQKGIYLYLIFGLYLKKNICKYHQIYSCTYKLPIKGKALPDINWLRTQDRMFFTPGQLWAGSTERIGMVQRKS